MNPDEQAPGTGTPDPANPTPEDQGAAPGTVEQQHATTAAEQQAIIDWEKRYNDLRPVYDRTTAEAAQYRQLIDALKSDDPAVYRQAAEQIGLEFADEEKPVYDDPMEELRAELDMTRREFREFLDSQKQAEQEKAHEAQLDAIDQDARKQLADLGDLDDAQRDWIYDRAVASHPPTPEGRVNIAAAHKEFEALIQAHWQRWVQSKDAPHISPAGQSATEAPNLDDPQQMEAWQIRRLRELNSQQ